jgi:hypothetical protein
MAADDKTLTLTQNDSIAMADFYMTDQDNDTDLETTNLVADSTSGSISVLTGDDNSADKWKSITATAENNIELSGSGNINIASAGLSSNSGGVKVVSTGGAISTPGAGGKLDAPITGYSDEVAGTGVVIDSGQKAAIVISSNDELNLGSDAVLKAYGNYYTSDDRGSVNFKYKGLDSGDPIDVAIYLNSFGMNLGNNVDVDSSKITISQTGTGIGTLVVDAYDTVTFGDNFDEGYLQTIDNTIRRIEVASRISQTIDQAQNYTSDVTDDKLPYAYNPDIVLELWENFGILPESKYVLRGEDGGVIDLAWVLGDTKPVPLSLPKPLAPQDQGQVEIEIENVQELGLGDKPELAEAYPPSLDTDLNLDKAAQKLYGLLPILRDSSRITALNSIVVETWQNINQPLTQEQETVIAQRIGASTAGPWVAALTDYADVLMNMVGRPEAESVLWIMQTYVIPPAQQGLIQDQTVAFIEAQISGIGG